MLLNVPDYEPVLQNEEHLVVETPAAERFQPGDEVYADADAHLPDRAPCTSRRMSSRTARSTETWDIVGARSGADGVIELDSPRAASPWCGC